jgi:geranylgeranyl pyrophosphate synthase
MTEIANLVHAGGKRIRPMVVLLVAHAAAGSRRPGEPTSSTRRSRWS